MKVFFGLLLIANVAFAAFQWLLPHGQLFAREAKIPVAEELRLLSESGSGAAAVEDPVVEQAAADQVQEPASTTETVAAVVEKLVAAVQPEPVPLKLCYSIGPFKERSHALEVSARYASRDISSELRPSTEQEYLGVMVYIDGHASRQEAIDTAEELASKGVRDYIIVNEPGKSNVLSMGVFGLKKNAERRQQSMQNLGYPAIAEPRYRERTIFWLYQEQSGESEPLKLLDEKDTASGVSRIASDCA